MVFESIVADLLNRFLGDYVENLDRSQLKIGIWGGDVVLENLHLKESALDNLDLPVKTTFGHLGKLVLKIPWKNLYSAPVEATIERLYLLAIPNKDIKYDAEKEALAAQNAKMAELARIEEAKKREKEKDKPKPDDTFVEKLATQIIKNVQVKIQDIHVRYEDRGGSTKPFALGFTLHNLSVQTTDENWVPCVVQDAVSLIHKVLTLEGLAVYWNPNTEFFSHGTPEEILKHFHDGICTKSMVPVGYSYILGPINSTSRLKLNPKPETDGSNYTIPKVQLNLRLEKLAVGLGRLQYLGILDLIDSLEQMTQGAPYRKFRPNFKTYKGHYRDWWHFAYRCILEEQVKRRRRDWSWEHVLAHRAMCRSYASLYKTKLTSRKLTAEQQKSIEECEKKLDVFNIVIIRQRIELEVEKEGRKQAEKKAAGGWFSSWFGGSGAPAPAEEDMSAAAIAKKFEDAMTPEEKSKLYQAIDYQENAATTSYPVEFVANDLEFVLECLEITVKDEKQRVIDVSLHRVTTTVHQRPAGQAIKVVTKVHEFVVSGIKQNGTVPKLAVPWETGEDKALWNIMFETNPLDKSCDQRIHVKALPLNIIYDAQTINNIVEVFKKPADVSLSQLQAAAGSTLEDLREMSATGLQHAIQKHSVLDLQVDLQAPYILIPRTGFYTGSEDLLVIVLGGLKMVSLPRDQAQADIRAMLSHGSTEDDVLQTMMSRSYDNFKIVLSNVQLLIAEAGEDWKSNCNAGKSSPMHLLQPSSLSIGFGKCLITDDPRLPKMKITGELPNIEIDISEKRLISLLSLVTSIPTPGQDEALPPPTTESLSRSSSITTLTNLWTDATTRKDSKTKHEGEDDSQRELVQSTDIDVRFRMGDFRVSVFQNLSPVTTKKLMDFAVIRLELEFTKRTFDMTAAVRLGGLGLDFHDTDNVLQLVSTPLTSGREEYLLGITFTSVDRKSPELRTKHGCVLQLVQLDFTTLDLLLHQEALVAIMEFANSLMSKLSEVKPSAPEAAAVKEALPKIQLPTILEEEGAEIIVPRTKPKKKGVVETIDFKLQATMKDVNVHIANRSQKLTDLIVAGLETKIVVKKSYTEIIAALKTLLVLDPKEETIHHKILSVVGDEAFSMQLVLYNIDEGKFNPDEVNMSIKLDMGCLRIVFLNWFVSSLLSFINTFQEAQQAVAQAAAGAAEAAAQNVKELRDQAVRVAMAIKLKAPVIIVPAHSKSVDALLLDFGDLTINNKFQTLTEKNKHGDPAVVDELHVALHNLKMSRVKLDEEASKVLAECLLLQPITCGIMVQRNLSSAWYKNIPDIDISGRLETISITLSQEDFKTTMLVLTGNLAEGPQKVPASQPEKKQIESSATETSQLHRPSTLDLQKVTAASIDAERTLSSSTDSVNTSMKFSFTMDSLVVNLYSGGAKDLEGENVSERDPNTGLGRFTLHVLAIKGRMLSDGSLSTSVVLVDCLLDDTRKDTSAKITRLMESREDLQRTPAAASRPESSSTGGELSVKSMLDVTFQQKATDMFADVRVFGFTLILSVDYFVRIADFFVSGLPQAPSSGPPPVAQQPGRKSQISTTVKETHVVEPAKQMMTINLKLEKPDIILVENMENLDTSAIILNMEFLFKLRASEDHQVMNGSIKDLQLYSCCFNLKRRKETMAEILRPCSISLAGSTPQGEGMHIDVCLTDIALAVSPGTIELLTRIQSALTQAQSKEDEAAKIEPDYSDIWKPKPFQDTDFWFLKTEMGEDVMELDSIPVVPAPPKGEILILSAPSIVITVEAGVGTQTLPMVLLDVGFQGTVTNWSSELHVESSMTVQMAYYNSALAVWEPLIEPVETLRDGRSVHVPWEIVAMVHKNLPEVISSPKSPSAADAEEIQFRPAALSIDVCSKETLELTMTKTCLDMLNNLGKAFQSAVNEGVTARIGAVAPYLVINDTGLSITVKLEDGPFQPLDTQPDGEYKQVMLGSGARVGLCLKKSEKRNYRSMLMAGVEADSRVQEKFLSIRVNERAYDLQLPVVRANKRYFSLHHRGEGNDPWGLVSDVQVKDGGTVITLRSIIQIHNHFLEPVAVYYMTKRGNEVECVGTVESGGVLNLPLYAVYTPTNELFFSVEGYTVSVVPFVWKELQNMLSASKLLQCEPKSRSDKEPFYIKVVGEMEQVYFEDTTRHTMISTCYNLHLRPAVIVRNYLPVDAICFVEGLATERALPAGGHIQLPTAEPGKTTIVLRLPDYLEKEWSCKHEIVNNAAEFAVWTFESYDSVQKVCLDLGMHTVTKNGSIEMSLYCPFWMLNKTGLMLSYRKSRKTEKSETAGSPIKRWASNLSLTSKPDPQSDESANVLYHPENFKGPVLFSFKAKSFFGKKKASVKVEDGEWSDKFSLDVAGSSGMVTCKANGIIYQIGVHIQMTYSSLTNQVIFTPYHVVINRADFLLECRETERPADPWVLVNPEECAAFWPRSSGNVKEMIVRVKGTKETTAPFSFATAHTTLLKLENKYGGINVDVQMMEGAVYLTFESYKPGLAPAIVMNHTSREIQIWEKGVSQTCKLQPKEMVTVTWECPTGSRQLVWNAGQKKEATNDLKKDGIENITVIDREDKSYWVSFLDGMQRVLLFTDDMSIARDAEAAGELETVDQEITVSIHGMGFSLVNNIICAELLYVGIASSGIIWETRKGNNKRFKPLSIKECLLIEDAYQKYLTEIQMAITGAVAAPPTGRVVVDGKIEVDFENEEMIKPNKRRLRRTFQTGLWFQMKTSPNQTQLHAKVNRLQIDNQMYDCIFPVILAPVPPPKSVAADSALKPFAEVSIVKRVVPYSTVQQYKYFKVLVQEFHVKVDIGFVNALLELFEAGELTDEQEAERFAEDRGVVDKPLLAHVALQSSQEQKNFYDLLHFSPLKIHLSFSLSDSSHKSVAPKQQGSQILNVFMQTLGVTLTDVQDVIFKLAYFERQYTFLTQKQLVSEASMHYVGQSLKQLYVLVLGLDVIGNPYGLVVGLTEGVGDLFYEPFQGAIQGPGEFAEGLVLGVRSLFGHTVGGAAGAVSRITDAMGKGVAALTFDKEFQRKRREAMHQRPANIQTGLAQSGKGLVMGVVGGVSGVIMKPISGAREEGVEGFFKGVGKGMVGLVARPTAGVIDFASGSLEAVKRVAEMSEETMRLRPPRFFQQDGLVRPYVRLQAEGNKLLQEVDKGRYASTDIYVHHLFIGKDVLMLTDRRVLYVVKSEIFGGWQVDWDHTWASMTTAPRVVDRGVFISTGEPKKKVLGLFGSSETGKVILIKDPDLKQWLVMKMEELMVAK